MRVSNLAIEELHQIAEGKRKRGAGFQIAAIRLMTDHTLPKPAQEHELSGSVTINVQCAIPTKGAPQHLVNVTPEKEAERVDSPIRGRYVNSSAEPQDVVDPMRLPSVIEDGKLVGAPDNRTRDERRDAERAAWLADASVHEGDK